MKKLDGMNINNPTRCSEPSKHLQNKTDHCFTWALIPNAPKNAKAGKKLETSFIALWIPDLNEENDIERLVLFRNGVTENNC